MPPNPKPRPIDKACATVTADSCDGINRRTFACKALRMATGAGDMTNSRSNSKLGSNEKRTSCSELVRRCKACKDTDSNEPHMSKKVRRADSHGFLMSDGTSRAFPTLAQNHKAPALGVQAPYDL